MLYVNFENLTFNSFFKFLSMINPVSSSILFKMKLLPSLDMYSLNNYQKIKKYLDIDIFLYIYNSP